MSCLGDLELPLPERAHANLGEAPAGCARGELVLAFDDPERLRGRPRTRHVNGRTRRNSLSEPRGRTSPRTGRPRRRCAPGRSSSIPVPSTEMHSTVLSTVKTTLGLAAMLRAFFAVGAQENMNCRSVVVPHAPHRQGMRCALGRHGDDPVVVVRRESFGRPLPRQTPSTSGVSVPYADIPGRSPIGRVMPSMRRSSR